MSEADLDDIFGADEPSQSVDGGSVADLDDIFGSDGAKQRSAAPRAGTLADLFDDDDDDNGVDDNAVVQHKPVVKRSNIDDLFDSDESGSDQDASSKPKRLSHKKKRKYEDSDDDDHGETRRKNKSSSERKIRRKEKKLRPNREKRREKAVDDSGNPVDGGDEYDSDGEPARTKEDDDFLSDESDEDNAAVVREYDGDNQDFDDDRPLKSKQSKKSLLADPSSGVRGRSAAGGGKAGGNDPFSLALASLKAKKVEAWTDSEKQAYVDRLQVRMREACKNDDGILAQNRARGIGVPPRPALQKLEMLDSVQHALSMSMLWETMLDREILITLGYWIRPRPDNSLPALPIRTAIYESLLKLPAMPDHLKKSSLIPDTNIFIKPIGQIIFDLLKHKQETMDNKKLLRTIIDKWSREIFSKGTEILAQSMTAYRNDAEVQARLASKYDAAQQARLKIDEEAKYLKDNHQRARAPLILGHMFTVQPDIDKKALKRAHKAKEGGKDDDEAMEVKDRSSGGTGDGGSGGRGGSAGGKNVEGGRAALLKRMEGGRGRGGGASAGSDSKRAMNVSVARPSYDFH